MSLKTLKCIFTFDVLIKNPLSFNDLIIPIIGMKSNFAYNNLVYLISIEDKENYVCSCNLCRSGHPVYIMADLCLNMMASRSSVSFGSQLLEKYPSNYTSRSHPLTGCSMLDLYCVTFKYLDNNLADSPCSLLRNIEKRARWWVI